MLTHEQRQAIRRLIAKADARDTEAVAWINKYQPWLEELAAMPDEQIWTTAGAKKYGIYNSKNIIPKKWRFVNNSAGLNPLLTLDKSINEPTKKGL